MTFCKCVQLVIGAAAITMVLGCSSLPGDIPKVDAKSLTDKDRNAAAMKSSYLELARIGDGKVFALDPKLSTVRMFSFRGGRAGRLGHNHVLSAPEFTGFAYLPGSVSADAKFDLEFRLDQLEIDNPQYREALGGTFAAPLSKAAIEGVREHMLGEDNLQADRFPFVRIHSTQITGELPKFAAQMQVEMHGQKQLMWVPLSVEELSDRLAVKGAFVLRQTSFGATPYSVAGGLLAVKDEVIVEFHLVGALLLGSR
ncbi:MAG: YceI family protein [Betaproteobacteria bacterium]|nr:YceI family protein [Betaproteobacteria bacterium]